MDRLHSTVKKVKDYIEMHKMLELKDSSRAEGIVVGVSGGADSVCLLKILKELQEDRGYELKAVHVNHMIRPEAEADEKYTETLCRNWGIPFSCHRVDVELMARERSLTCEEAGRIARYDIFRKEAGENYLIATAHHRGDQAETVLLNLFRGTGLRGLGGIAPVNGRIIRPILCLEREEIEAYLESEGIDWCIDNTNDTDAYTRNRIRRHIIPYAEEKVNKGAAGHIADAADTVREAAGYISSQVDKACAACVSMTEGSELALNIEEYEKLDSFIKGELLHRLISDAAGARKDISRIHIEKLRELCDRQGNRSLDLPYEVRAVREYGTVTLKRITHQEGEGQKDRGPDTLPEISVRTFNYEENMIIPKKGYTKWFDYDKIVNIIDIDQLQVRTRGEGDFIIISTEGRKKSINRLMIDEKIPSARRGGIPLVAAGSEILWAIGIRGSQGYNIDEDTKMVLEISVPDRNTGG